MDSTKSESLKTKIEIVSSGPAENTIRIEGNPVDVIMAWQILTLKIAEAVDIPLPMLLAICSILKNDLEDMARNAEQYSIDLSRPIKKDTP